MKSKILDIGHDDLHSPSYLLDVDGVSITLNMSDIIIDLILIFICSFLFCSVS